MLAGGPKSLANQGAGEGNAPAQAALVVHVDQVVELGLLEQRLERMEMKLDVSPEALAEIAKVGFDPVFGARPLKRAIQHKIENPVAKLILEGRFGPKDTIPVTVDGGEFHFGSAAGRTVH